MQLMLQLKVRGLMSLTTLGRRYLGVYGTLTMPMCRLQVSALAATGVVALRLSR